MECGGGRRSGKATALFFSNLYPPLTPVPQCVAEIRAIGQSPIHRHPEYFKVKPSLLNKKVLLIKGLLSPLFLPFALSPAALHAPFSLWSAVLSSHLGNEKFEVSEVLKLSLFPPNEVWCELRSCRAVSKFQLKYIDR